MAERVRVRVVLDERVAAALEREAEAAKVSRNEAACRLMERGFRREPEGAMSKVLQGGGRG